MTTRAIAAALERVKTVLRRRPDMGLQDDVPASARWEGGLRVAASHTNGTLVATDMPVEIGGTGDRVSPGWMFRAGIASCAATTLAMAAAVEGIELERLEVDIRSRSDARGLFGMADERGARVLPHAPEIARGVPHERLREFVERSLAYSPIPRAVTRPVPLALTIETRLVCGYLACDARLARMLLAGLPPIVRVNVRGSNAGIWLEASVRYALAEARSPRPGGAGVLAECLQQLVGSSPMQFLTQWCMRLAANLLARSNAPLARIAEDVGYQTDTAFSRAFRREYGEPPAAWRRNQAARTVGT